MTKGKRKILYAVLCVFITCFLALPVSAASIPTVQYKAHVQRDGWLNIVKNGSTAGTVGQSKRLEALNIVLRDSRGNSMIQYCTHVSDIGWQRWKNSGETAGTTGQSKSIEAIQIKLKGTYVAKYDVYYRLHVAHYGWLGWAKNGQTAGSTGLALRAEAIQVKLVKKNSKFAVNGKAFLTKPLLTYKAHCQLVGWQKDVKEEAIAGTTGEAKRLEALVINLKDFSGKNGIQYRAHVADIGWQEWKISGKTAGTTGQSKAIEAVQIQLSLSLSNCFDIYYRLHVAEKGWLGWAKNGAIAGTTGGGIRAEAIQIKLVTKGSSFNTGGDAYVDASNKSKTLSINWGNISSVGNQAARRWTGQSWQSSDSCACFAMAYCRTILDGRVHYWNEYDVNGGTNQYNACAGWGKAGYRQGGRMTANEIFKLAYDNINEGKPFVVFVQGSRSSWHYITIVGYQNVSSVSTLNANNFLIIDSCPGTTTKNAENMGAVGYSLKKNGSGLYEYIYS